jgi:hypothetical protein
MRRFPFLVLATLAFALALAATTAHAQDIRGVSFRPTDEMPPGTGSGSASITVNDDGTYAVSADLSGLTNELVLDDFDGAGAFVVWAVDMTAVEHPVGALNADLVLEPTNVDFLVAQPEASADSSSREGEVLFRAKIREPDASAAAAATATPAAAPSPTAAAAATDDDEPKELPKTGELVRDLLVLAAVGIFLIFGGIQLRRVRARA